MESNRQVVSEMNHKDEPRKLQNRQPSPSRLGEGRRDQDRTNSRGLDQRTGGVCVGDMSGSAYRVSGETCAGGSDPTGSASLATSEAVVAGTGVGDLRRSVDLWESQREQREVTCCAAGIGSEGRGDGSQGLPTPDKVRQLQVTLHRKLTPTRQLGKPDAGKPPVRFDEGRKPTVIGLAASHSVVSAYSTQRRPERLKNARRCNPWCPTITIR